MGCSYHIIGGEHLLTNFRPTSFYIIGLPKESRTIALQEGDTCLDPTISIKNVLFVSDLKCYSLSLSQLDTTYFIILINSVCIL